MTPFSILIESVRNRDKIGVLDTVRHLLVELCIKTNYFSSPFSCSKAGLAKSVSAATLRSQTTANLRALAASSKAPSTSALIAEAKKGQMKAVYASGGQNRMQLLSPKPGTSSTSGKGGSSNMGSRYIHIRLFFEISVVIFSPNVS